MKISVYLHTILGRQTPEGVVRELQIDLPQGFKASDLPALLQIELSADQIMLVVNGVMAAEDQILTDGDRVNLMPAISGGSADT